MQALSVLSLKEKLGEEGYSKYMRKKSLKAVRRKREMIKSGELVLLEGKYRKRLVMLGYERKILPRIDKENI